MVTKWRNRIALVLLSLLFTYGCSGIVSVFTYMNQYSYQDYFHTPWFQGELSEFVQMINVFEGNDLSLEEAKKKISVTQEEIIEYRSQYGTLSDEIANIDSYYEGQIQEAQDLENSLREESLRAEHNEKITEITKVFQDDTYVESEIKKEEEESLAAYYEKREKYRNQFLASKETYKYYFENSHTGEVYYNTSDADLSNVMYSTPYSFSQDFSLWILGVMYGEEGYEENINQILEPSSESIDGKIGVVKGLATDHPIMVEYNNYAEQRQIVIIHLLSGLAALLVSLWILKKQPVRLNEKWTTIYKKWPFDVRLCLLFGSILLAVICAYIASVQIAYVTEIAYDAVESAILLFISSVFWLLAFLQWNPVISVLLNWKSLQAEWKTTLILKIGLQLVKVHEKIDGYVTQERKTIRKAFFNQPVGFQVMFMTGLIFLLGAAAVSVFIHPARFFIYIVLPGVIGVPLVFKLVEVIAYFNTLVEKIEELAMGKMKQEIAVKGQSVLSNMAQNINITKDKVQTSQTEQAKSERLKSELITNVSHDLRTPLTSIITYTELLKRNDVSTEEKNNYLEIIDRKSQRLKVLIDDLFEVSKMATGNIELTKSIVDIVQLLQQALAEHDDKITHSGLIFRVTHTNKPIYVLVDGQKIWRVFDNLIGNILKYSLEMTRVYIDTSIEEDQAVISFKNVSKYELNENSEELSERFKRGDTSRHTEGSGLGLAIAQSLLELHGGKLLIQTDGDLFKVKVILNIVASVETKEAG